MIRHYLLHFFRNLQRQKLFSFINLLGLTVSMASTLLIYLYVHHEFSFDRFHNDAERIYRINQTFIYGENSDHQFASTGPGVANAVKQEVSEVDLITSIHTPGDFIISYVTPNQEVIAFEEDRVLAADTNFFHMFNFPFVKGDPASALRLANTRDPPLMTALVALVVLMAMISSIYPALFLNGFHPVEALKGKIRVGREGKSFRNGLVVFQFTMSIVLIICTGIVFEQLKFVSEKSLGFDKENLLVLEHVEGLKNGQTLADAARNIPGVRDVSWCTSLPPKIWGGDRFSAEGLNGISFPLNYTSSDDHYLYVLDIKLLVGGNFSKDNPADANSVILNEMAIRKIGWNIDESVIGKKIQSPDGGLSWEVIGVVADFHHWSLENPIEPMAIFNIKNTVLNTGQRQFLALRIEPQDTEAWQNTLTTLNALWKTHAGDAPFQYTFVDQTFAETFKTQNQFATVLSVMAGLAILIASLGLLGMIIYALEQRTKEIGIRKISGATVWQILMLISKGYTRLILLAFVVGAPLSYWLIHEWLKDFAYRIAPSIMTFVLTGAGTLLIAVLITSYHSIRAALQNPVDILKDE